MVEKKIKNPIFESKSYCLHEYRFLKNYYSADYNAIEKAIDRSFGVIMFTINNLFDYNSSESIELREWWENAMLPKFRRLQKERG